MKKQINACYIVTVRQIRAMDIKPTVHVFHTQFSASKFISKYPATLYEIHCYESYELLP